MTDRTCTIEGCFRSLHARGWCNTHYMRWLQLGDPLAPKQRSAWGEPLAWLETIADEGDGEGCREWPFASHTDGYGSIWHEGRARPATHVVLALVGRPRPPGLEVLHSCDNPPCCAPWHLSWGTNKANFEDMTNKRRGWWQQPHIYRRTLAPRRKQDLCWCGRPEEDDFHVIEAAS